MTRSSLSGSASANTMTASASPRALHNKQRSESLESFDKEEFLFYNQQGRLHSPKTEPQAMTHCRCVFHPQWQRKDSPMPAAVTPLIYPPFAPSLASHKTPI